MSNNNTYIRTLYSQGFSSLMMSFFQANLTLNFVPYLIKENGQVVTKVIQSGLDGFVKMLEAYLTEIGANLHLNKLSEEKLEN